MNDPTIDAILWHLLARREYVTLEMICWWDSTRAENACLSAHLRQVARSQAWVPTAHTAAWFEETWNAIRSARPTTYAERSDTDDSGEDYLETEAPAEEVAEARPASTTTRLRLMPRTA